MLLIYPLIIIITLFNENKQNAHLLDIPWKNVMSPRVGRGGPVQAQDKEQISGRPCLRKSRHRCCRNPEMRGRFPGCICNIKLVLGIYCRNMQINKNYFFSENGGAS